MNLLLSSPPLPRVRGGWRWHPPPEPHEASSLVCLSQARMLVAFVLPSLQRLEAVTSPSSLGSWRRYVFGKAVILHVTFVVGPAPLPYPTRYWSRPLHILHVIGPAPSHILPIGPAPSHILPIGPAPSHILHTHTHTHTHTHL